MAAPTGLSTAGKKVSDEEAVDQATRKPEYVPAVVPTSSEDMVSVRVLPLGDGKVSKGEYDLSSNSFPFYKRGERFRLDRSIAQAQEANGLLEIEG